MIEGAAGKAGAGLVELGATGPGGIGRALEAARPGEAIRAR